MYQGLTLAAGIAVEFQEAADFFRVMKSPTTDLTVIFYAAGKEVARAENVGAGYAEKTGVMFDRVRISSAAGGDVAFVLRLGNEVRYETPPNGNVTVTNTAGAHANTRATVTSGAVSTLAAAKSGRRFLLVQNNDASIALRITCDGVDPTIAQGIRIAPGGYLLLDAFPPTGAIKAIAESGAGIAIEVQEG